MTSTTDATPPTQPAAEMSDVEKIKAAHAARLARRRAAAPATSATPNVASNSTPSLKAAAPATTAEAAGTTAPAADGDATSAHAQQVAELQQQITTLRLEMTSVRRNNLQNLKTLAEQRDMFASQLAREQQGSGSAGAKSPAAGTAKKLSDLEAQLRAARTRNADLEEENVRLRDDVKQLNFRVQASKTLDAAADGYEIVVDELVDVKVKCAQLQEEKEELLHMNKELMSTSAVLRDANGELEKSRSQWVLQCADLEKKRTELEEQLKAMEETSKRNASEDTSYSGSDLQELKL